MNVIIDTNCLIASIPPKNPEYWLYRAFRQKAFIWVISPHCEPAGVNTGAHKTVEDTVRRIGIYAQIAHAGFS